MSDLPQMSRPRSKMVAILWVAVFSSSRAAPTTIVLSTLTEQAVHFHDPNSDASHYSQCCGMLHEPACTYENTTLSLTMHSCYSEARPTIGAIRDSNGTYVCSVCGRPNGPACECTFDNEANKHDHGNLEIEKQHRPCQGEMDHWCLDGPEYFPSPDSTGVFDFVCIQNTTYNVTEEEEHINAELTPLLVSTQNSTQLTSNDCGLLGERSCLDPHNGVHSCASPGPHGQTVRAMPYDESDPNTHMVCVACGHKGARRCPEQHPEDELADLPQRTCEQRPNVDVRSRKSASLSSGDSEVAGLSTGAIVGIVIGSLAAVAIVAGIARIVFFP